MKLKSEIQGVRGEIRDVRGEITAVKSEIKEFMLWGFGVTFAGIFALIGFVLWDRRTALARMAHILLLSGCAKFKCR